MYYRAARRPRKAERATRPVAPPRSHAVASTSFTSLKYRYALPRPTKPLNYGSIAAATTATAMTTLKT